MKIVLGTWPIIGDYGNYDISESKNKICINL